MSLQFINDQSTSARAVGGLKPFRCPGLLPGSACAGRAAMHKDVVQMARWHTSPTMGHILVMGDRITTGTRVL